MSGLNEPRALIASKNIPAKLGSELARLHTLVAVDEDVVGVGALDGPEIRRLYVLPSHQNRGIGSTILAKLEEQARRAGLREVFVRASPSSASFYASRSHRRVGERDNRQWQSGVYARSDGEEVRVVSRRPRRAAQQEVAQTMPRGNRLELRRARRDYSCCAPAGAGARGLRLCRHVLAAELQAVGQTAMNDAQHQSLLAAIARKDLAGIQVIVGKVIDLNIGSDNGAPPLFAAVLSGELEIVRCLLRHGADPNFVAQEPGATTYSDRVLELAQQARFLVSWDTFQPIVELLVEHGAADSDGRSDARASATVKQRTLDHQRRK